jgi:transcriptional regulator GlxA family with amidase domain
MGMPKIICLLAYNGMELLDFAGPQSAFYEASQSKNDSYEVLTIGLDAEPITCAAGLTIVPSIAIWDVGDCHTLIIPGGKGSRSPSFTERQLCAISALMHKSLRVVSICTGAFLSARAGLPHGTVVATHWAHGDELKQQFPSLAVDDESLFVSDGKYWSSAGITSGIDLTLRLIELDEGRELAHHVAKHLVVYIKRSGNQKQFSDILDLQTPKTQRLQLISDWIKQHMSEDITVRRLAELIHVTERQCHRIFLRETNLTPAQYVEKYRMQVASMLLTDKETPLNAIASVVGYKSYEGFARAFERNFSVTPGNYRKAFLMEN